jgi:hypothetical protein
MLGLLGRFLFPWETGDRRLFKLLSSVRRKRPSLPPEEAEEPAVGAAS